MNIALLFGTFLILMALGLPIALTMGASAALYIVCCTNISPLIIMQQTVSGVNNYVLLAAPFFIMAGALMESGGISKRLVRFCMSLVGHCTGGLAMVVVVACAFFAAMSGSAIATTAAVGAIMIPYMYNNGYDKDFACALTATSGIFGPLIPPSIVMVLYAVNANQSVGTMLIAGAVPGFVMVLCTGLLAVFVCRRNGWKGTGHFDIKEVWTSFIDAIWAILSPLIILGGIYSGIFTATEAAAVACFYSMIVGLFVYHELNFKTMIEALGKAMKSTGNIMLIVASSCAFSFVLSREHVASMAASAMLSFSSSRIVFLICVVIIMLITGCFVDASPAVMVLAPILAPIAEQYGVSLVHLGAIMVTATSIGMVTPPLGMNMYMAAQIGNRPIHKVIPATIPFIFVTVIGLLVVTFVPQLSLWLPGLMHT
ncbi:C4-dicarboxylate transporter, DctM subunit [Ruminococcaceae bacterium D5]|nr:C4-dicarboxylate transporter, DctM subunit [Ruminococcaceae bacterium D5]